MTSHGVLSANTACSVVRLSWLLIYLSVAADARRARSFRAPPTAPELIRNAGYPVQVLTVQTKDGYLLEVHRIPHSRNGTLADRGRPVLLLHGLRASSAGWIINPRQSLAFMLADAGYDVWLANNRGNLYAKKHISLDTNSREYWNFPADYYAKYDNPALIDYILRETGENELFYLGFSISTWSFWAMMNYFPEYNAKVRLMVAMAPFATRMYYTSFARKMVPVREPINNLYALAGVYETVPYSPKYGRIGKIFCNKYVPTKSVCALFFFLYAGWDPKQLDKSSLPSILTHVPAGCGNLVLMQLDQAIMSGNFQRYDYGEKANLQIYGQPDPPMYYPENVTTPVVLLWGKNDKVADRRDVALLASRLPNLVASERVDWLLWQHLDFLWGIDANTLVYQRVLLYMDRFGGPRDAARRAPATPTAAQLLPTT